MPKYFNKAKIISKPGATLEVKAYSLTEEGKKALSGFPRQRELNDGERDDLEKFFLSHFQPPKTPKELLNEYYGYYSVLNECDSVNTVMEAVKHGIFVFLSRKEQIKLLFWLLKTIFKKS